MPKSSFAFGKPTKRGRFVPFWKVVAEKAWTNWVAGSINTLSTRTAWGSSSRESSASFMSKSGHGSQSRVSTPISEANNLDTCILSLGVNSRARKAHEGSRASSLIASGLRPRSSRTFAQMLSTVASAPEPVSLQARVLTTGSITVAPNPTSWASCLLVSGWSHMCVFMAGASTNGLSTSQARATQVNRLSQIPFASLPRVLAESGAIRKRSAHLRNSMWSTGSSLTLP
mmetsp:Transcript_1950/g.6082  ORF Transcript_1950/g.6082 Transcript_1950/m.6082 type:complete len:229 (+) Transcript_1950:485-1171(+)